MNTLTRIIGSGVAALVLGASSWAAQAASVSWDFNYLLPQTSGGTGSYTAAGATLTLEDTSMDIGGTATAGVRFTLTNLLGGTSFPDVSTTKLTRVWFSSISAVTSGQFVPPDPNTYDAAFDSNGGGAGGYSFDYAVTLNQAASSPVLGYGDMTSWFISGHALSDFLVLTSGNNGPDTYSMVMMQGNLVTGGAYSYHFIQTETVVPEPETYALMAVGVGLLGLMVRRRKAA